MQNSEDIPLKANVGWARKLARKLLKDVKITSSPVSLHTIVGYLKEEKNLAVIRHPFGENISGVLVTIDEIPTIGVNQDHPLVRQRFTVAHEIGHLMMDHVCEGINRKTVKETEAHQFAAELLVPLKFLKEDFKKTPDVNILARQYIVSRETLCIHLMECRLI